MGLISDHAVCKSLCAFSIITYDNTSIAYQRCSPEFIVVFFLTQNLTMFGVDIIVEKGTGHHVVIDINYFPGECSWYVLSTV